MSIRVHQLAKELGIPSKELVEKCQAAGYEVATHSSSLSDEEAEDMRRRLGSAAEQPAAAPPAPTEPVAEEPPEVAPKEQLARARMAAVSLPTRRTRPSAHGKRVAEVAPPPPAQEPEEVEVAIAEPVLERPIEVIGEKPPEAVAKRPKKPKIPKRKAPKLAARPKQKMPPAQPAAVRPHPQAVGPAAVAAEEAGPAAVKGERVEEAVRPAAARGAPEVEAPVEGKVYPDQIRKKRGGRRRRGAVSEDEEVWVEEDARLARSRALRRRERGFEQGAEEEGSLFAEPGAPAVDTQWPPAGVGIAAPPERKPLAPERPFRRSMRATAPVSMRPVTPVRPSKVELQEPITVRDLSAALGIKVSDLILYLMQSGVMATINQTLDAETVGAIAAGYDVEVVIRRAPDPEEQLLAGFAVEDDPKDLRPRAPVVTFLGHVDHGKTSLLDRIRQTQVAASEAGGITQHIGAYRVPFGERWVTFLDTPGHEAFTAMRARGARVTDVVVLVVAADDGIMPQTEEAISHARAAGVPIVVAINKIDLPQANPQRVLQQLSALELVPEEWGGKTVCVQTSAVTGAGLDQLLEYLSLEAELLELRANPERPAIGTVVEAELTESYGAMATLLVQNGTLHQGDVVLVGGTYGRVRNMVDNKGQAVAEAGPSVPVKVAGLADAPQAGDKFYVVDDLSKAKSIADARQKRLREKSLAQRRHVSLENLSEQIAAAEVKELLVILKADVQGSIEAIRDALQRLEDSVKQEGQQPKVRVRILHAAVGGISESDVLLADASDAIIVGFNVAPDARARELAEQTGIQTRLYKVIYKVTEDIKQAMEGLLAPIIEERRLGEAEVRQTFRISRVGTVAGCFVADGQIRRTARIRVIRDGVVIHEGRLESLKRFKDDAREVGAGMECGIKIAGFDDIKVGDRLEAFETVEVKQTL